MHLRANRNFFKRFWWLVIILGVLLSIAILVTTNYIFGGGTRIAKTFTPATESGFYVNPPTIVDDFLYIGTSVNTSFEPIKNNYFYKLDLDLNLVWEYALPEYHEVEGGGALDSHGNIYFKVSKRTGKKMSTQENHLYSLANDGAFRWKKKISYDGEKFESGPTTVAIGVDDTIYAGGSRLTAFLPDGSEQWTYPRENKVWTGSRSSPIIDQQGNIYYVAPEPTNGEQTETIKAYKFSPQGNGTPIWETELENNIIVGDQSSGNKVWVVTSTPALSTDQRTMIAAVGNTINAVNMETGEHLWSYQPEGIAGAFEASPAMDGENNIYIGTKANEKSVLYAIRSDGTGLLWQNAIGNDLYCSPSLGDNGILYIGSEYTPNDGRFHAIDMKTGEYLWSIKLMFGLKDFQKNSAAIHNGYAYIGTMKKNILGPLVKIKIDSQGYLPGAAWPRFHGGNENNGRKD